MSDVFLRGIGVGRVTEQVERDGKPFHVVRTEFRTTYAPVETAHALLRPLVSTNTATAMLAILRGPPTSNADRDAAISLARAQNVMEHGTAEDHASFLRALYAWDAPLVHGEAMTILHFETLVIDEIATVLALDRESLVNEMRERHPSMRAHIEANRASRSARSRGR